MCQAGKCHAEGCGGGQVAPGVTRHRVEYVHSELGRDLREAGHVTGGRLYARDSRFAMKTPHPNAPVRLAVKAGALLLTSDLYHDEARLEPDVSTDSRSCYARDGPTESSSELCAWLHAHAMRLQTPMTARTKPEASALQHYPRCTKDT